MLPLPLARVRRRPAVAAAGCLVAAAVAPTAGAAQAPRAALADRFDFSAPAYVHELPGRLQEASGLVVTAAGALLTHDDEDAILHQVDPVSGDVVRTFQLGRDVAKGDFEGIAAAGPRLFLVTSDADLYEFRDAGSGVSGFNILPTGLEDACEVEGLDHDPDAGTLLLACKAWRDDRDLVVMSVELAGEVVGERARVPWSALAETTGQEEFHASGIARDPATGTLLVLGADERLLVELDASGGLLGAVSLPADRHPQPEGIALLPDGALAIADEGPDGPGRLTVYRPSTPGP